MEKKKKLLYLLIALVLVSGLVAAVWKLEYSGDSLVTVDSGGCPWNETKSFDDMYLNTTDNNATDSTHLTLNLEKSRDNINVGFYEDIIDATGGECNYSDDCSSNLSYNSNPIYNNDLINMTQGSNLFNLTVACRWLSCDVNRTYLLNITEE